MNKPSLLVIGSHSLVGSRVIEQLDNSFEIETADQQEVDITDASQVEQLFENYAGKYVLSCAAATAVDEIENSRPSDPLDAEALNQDLAYQVNVVGVQNLVQVAIDQQKFLILISTDFVFDGEDGPYDENSRLPRQATGLTWYGWTKALADKLVLESELEDYLILRISFPYRRDYADKGDIARNWLKLYDKFASGELAQIYPIFTDQQFSPTFIDDLGPAIKFLLDHQAKGVFDITSPEPVTMYDFAVEAMRIGRQVEDPEALVPKGSLKSFMAEHPGYLRPSNSVLKADKIIELGFRPTSWKEGLAQAYGQH